MIKSKLFSVLRSFRKVAAGLAIAGVLLSAGAVYASHSWGGYHWARTANPFTLKLGDNVSSAWDSYLITTSSDWSVSSVLDTTIVTGAGKRNCRPVSGRTEVCNSAYGNNGWLGLAQIWINRSGHITQGAVKMNDSYFSLPTYDTSAWRNLVMCQEVGHTLGLDHQDENFDNANLGTCMDYTNSPDSNQHPNAHDYEQLELIYAHTDSSTTLSQTLQSGIAALIGGGEDGSAGWGKGARNVQRGHDSLFMRDLGNGEKLYTFVLWAE